MKQLQFFQPALCIKEASNVRENNSRKQSVSRDNNVFEQDL
jgi:hypothetical protein